MSAEIPEPALSRRDARKFDRRQAIIEAARHSFLEHGYAGTSMSALVKTLGGSKGTLWSYFPSKEELFGAVIEQVSAAFRAELANVLATRGELETVLAAFCRTFMRKISAPESLETWRLVVAESGRFPEVGQIFYQQAARHTREALTRFLEPYIAEGRLRQARPDHMAERLIDLCVGPQTRRLWGVEAHLASSAAEDADEIVQLFLRAYAPEPSAAPKRLGVNPVVGEARR
ncbi:MULTISPECIES: TetR/AcrR family transcriptional regulator [unclassified Sphingomonas]|uniref:TetR/AcrR family transcriptional regulator n=1 Tax=unclassified Sphingomonas TaxID=196159 RepID=UPI00226AD7C1|nr:MULTISPECIES: TetR/AcrR family transcriptional regulator [unclassified Sphingomonas]